MFRGIEVVRSEIGCSVFGIGKQKRRVPGRPEDSLPPFLNTGSPIAESASEVQGKRPGGFHSPPESSAQAVTLILH